MTIDLKVIIKTRKARRITNPKTYGSLLPIPSLKSFELAVSPVTP
jgi:hypothetical protein